MSRDVNREVEDLRVEVAEANRRIKFLEQCLVWCDRIQREAKAARPLREARIDVVDDKARPGCYKAVAYLRPHFQLEELGVSLRLVADLPASVK